jgi:TonB family protein
MREWAGSHLEQPPFMSSAQFRSWLWSAAIHAVVVGGIVAGTPTPHRPERQEAFRWEVQLTADKSASASSTEAERASWKPGRSVRESFAQRRSEPAETVVDLTAKQGSSQLSVQPMTHAVVVERSVAHAEPAVSTEGAVPIESAAVSAETEASSVATNAQPVSIVSMPETSRHETGGAVEQDKPAASAQESNVSEAGAVITSMQLRDEQLSDVGSSVQSVASERAPSRKDFRWVGLALRARVEEVKRYSLDARLNEWEGRAVIAASILADGRIVDIQVVETSGNRYLDEDAKMMVAHASPLTLSQSIGLAKVTVKVPIIFGLQ